jgi:hypothetical protein
MNAIIKKLNNFFMFEGLDLGNGKVSITSIGQIKNLLKEF